MLFLFGKKGHMETNVVNEVMIVKICKMCKQYETARTKGTFKKSDINKTNLYLNNTYNENT